MSTAVYFVLFIASSLYAWLLDRLQRIIPIEPDLTWLEVAIGSALCLLAGTVVLKDSTAEWEAYAAPFWGAFVIGGIPIIVWQVARVISRVRAALNYTIERRRVPREHDKHDQYIHK